MIDIVKKTDLLAILQEEKVVFRGSWVIEKDGTSDYDNPPSCPHVPPELLQLFTILELLPYKLVIEDYKLDLHEYERQHDRVRRAFKLIELRVDPAIFAEVQDHSTPCIAMREIETRYKMQDSLATQNMYDATARLTLDKCSSVPDYIDKMSLHRQDLKELGSTLSGVVRESAHQSATLSPQHQRRTSLRPHRGTTLSNQGDERTAGNGDADDDADDVVDWFQRYPVPSVDDDRDADFIPRPHPPLLMLLGARSERTAKSRSTSANSRTGVIMKSLQPPIV